MSASLPHRTSNQVLEVRTVSAENLIAMKLVSMRPYKYDESDIIGIIHEQKEAGKPVTYESVKRAVADLYGENKKLGEDAESALKAALSAKDAEYLYEKTKKNENLKGAELKDFDKKHPGVLDSQNLDNVLASIRNKKTDGKPAELPAGRLPKVQEQDETECDH